ncbi:MAG: Shikimate dehydrogenase (NADP(+)) [Chlamydiia bacterium]|nr:Shikimate dehydrogenase (NADP(+)) [Chlamydiia bacterium]MCH9618333.1 Shikimate dehydrogenase (NADP(+)) [Chlamydiia bacterium]MCH9624505.1 Shikimate dehydrogenase (NADP(+)) [Chlamydiia bacterium]
MKGEFCKIQIDSAALPSFFENIPPYDFLTVTMPHKLAVSRYCNEFTDDAKEIGSVNFISIVKGQLLGCNFDGIGALDVVEEKLKVKGKRVVVIGAGGAARAAIYEAKKREARVICVNRTEKKGEEIASFFDVGFQQQIPSCFDVLINATCVGMDKGDRQVLVKQPSLLKGKIVLDMASRLGDCLLKEQTDTHHGVYISGSKMFYALTHAGLEFICQKT